MQLNSLNASIEAEYFAKMPLKHALGKARHVYNAWICPFLCVHSVDKETLICIKLMWHSSGVP